MNIIGLTMNLLLAGLLVAAMVVGIRLNRRLKALRESHEHFEAAVRELNLAGARAEQGLADLRAATDEATDLLSDRIEKGRALAARLEGLVRAAPETPRAAATPERVAPRPLPPLTPPLRDESPQERLSNLIAMARSRIQAEEAGAPVAERAPALEPLVGRPPLVGRRIASMVDEDLFEDAPLELNRRVGAGR